MDKTRDFDRDFIRDIEKNTIYKAVWENSPDAFLLLDSQGNIILYNEATKKMFALPESPEKNKISVFKYLKRDFWENVRQDFNYVLKNGELKDCEYQALRDGYFFPINISYRKVNFDSLPDDYIILTGKDITKVKINERAVRKAKEKAEIADKLKTSFLANMSHEIRTPINAVIGFADLLEDPDLTEEEKKEYINTIQLNGELLLKLINDIIDIAKIESGQLKISKNEFGVNKLFEEIYLSSRNMLNTMEKPHLILDYHIDDKLKDKSLITDQYRLVQIINNLINNAIKFTDEGRIDFGVRLNRNNKIEFFVKDTGIGIPEKDIDIIFDRFGQVEEALDRNIGGTGLGLSISKSLVEILGGRIRVFSKENQGSEFVFTIDAIIKDGKETIKNKETIDFSGKKILIVEDTESNYRLLNILLEKHGAETIWALTGKQAVSICKNSRDIDLVLMDINLPDIDGYEATSMIKSFKPNLPIVAQTAYAMAGEEQRSRESGCDDYIPKPIIPDKLFKVLSNLIG